jgi:hypothetical protein
LQETPRCHRQPLGARFGHQDENQRGEEFQGAKGTHDAGPNCQAGTYADECARRHRNARILVERAKEREEKNSHGHRERSIFRVHEHVAVVERAS